MDKYKQNKLDRQIASRCCNFKNLEEECKVWSYEHLKISLKNEIESERYIKLKKVDDIRKFVRVNESGMISKVEVIDCDSQEIQNIRIYAKDEFDQEKYIDILVMIEKELSYV